MRAKNSREVTRSYLIFAITMFSAIIVGGMCLQGFILTSEREITHIELRSRQYDDAFARQIVLTEKVDSMYNNLRLLNSNMRLNEAVLQNRISTQKMNLINAVAQMDAGDVAMYGRLLNHVNDLLLVKDSINLLTAQSELTRTELNRCVEDNKIAARKVIFNDK